MGAINPPLPSAGQEIPVLIDPRQSLGRARLDDLFPEDRAALRRSLVTFSVLLGLASAIASFGLFQDSVAAIIGAMVVAPLGGAIMAFAGAMVTARDRWMVITFIQVVLGALGVILIGWLVAQLLPQLLTLTPSLEARTSPGLLDLGVALAAGAAGAYVAVRRTGSDALPGVAIAVSLVPPLATVGICFEEGRPDDALGALLLFTTNFAAIVVAACVIFVLAGAAPSREMMRERHRLRNGFAIAVIALVLIAIPLVATSLDRAFVIVRSTQGAPVVRDWVGSRDLSVDDWSIDGDTVTLRLSGSDTPGDPARLASQLAHTFGTPVKVEIDYVPLTHTEAAAQP